MRGIAAQPDAALGGLFADDGFEIEGLRVLLRHESELV